MEKPLRESRQNATQILIRENQALIAKSVVLYENCVLLYKESKELISEIHAKLNE